MTLYKQFKFFNLKMYIYKHNDSNNKSKMLKMSK